MEIEKLKQLTVGAVIALTGDRVPTPEYMNQVMDLFSQVEGAGRGVRLGSRVTTVPDIVISRAINRVACNYNEQKKYPELKWWVDAKKHYLKAWNTEHGVDHGEYVKPTREQWDSIAEQAKSIRKKFEAMAPTSSDTVDRGSQIAARRMKMIDHLRKGEVQITEVGHPEIGNWISLARAEGDNLKYYSPTHYLSEAERMGRFGTVSRRAK